VGMVLLQRFADHTGSKEHITATPFLSQPPL
jgi:hypothetical protein